MFYIWTGLKTVHSNVQHVHDDLADVESALSLHDTNIDGDLIAHDSNSEGDLVQHDSDIKSQLATHDATIKAQLAIHDADIKARLGEIQGTVDENQRLKHATKPNNLSGQPDTAAA